MFTGKRTESSSTKHFFLEYISKYVSIHHYFLFSPRFLSSENKEKKITLLIHTNKSCSNNRIIDPYNSHLKD